MSPNAPSGGLSLFPNTSATKPPSRRTTPKPRTSQDRGSPLDMSPSRASRRTPEPLSEFVIDGSPQAGSSSHIPSHPYYENEAGPSVSRPIPVSEVPPRTDTALSGASTLVRSSSNRSRSSIAKRPFDDASYPPPPPEASGIRSMFPQYDHSRAFDQQNYFPTRTSPRHIPRTVISRQSHYPPEVEAQQSPQQQQQYQQQSQHQHQHQHQQQMRSPVRSPVIRSPLSAGSANQRWPRWQPQEPPAIPSVSATNELRDYWKAANGWKASGTEGRPYCLKLTPEVDAPIYTLSSAAAQPLYHMRIDPTSASARVTLSRHDPGKTCKDKDPQAAAARSPGFLGALREAESSSNNNNNNNHNHGNGNGNGNGISSSNSSKSHNSHNKPWQEVLSTTLEEPARRLPPDGDGLVALLYPSAAARVALDRPGDASAVAAAERECARLVWDDDSANYFLAHPALAAPFCVTVERNAAWSRAEYALEHVESPRHLARLTRTQVAGGGGAGGEGFLEIDTAVAARVEGSYYILDVAVAALLLVAHLDEQRGGSGGAGGAVGGIVEQFAPPPMEMLQPPLPAHLREDGGVGGEERASMGSRISGFLHGGGGGGGSGGKHNNGDDAKAKDKKKKNKKRRRGKPTDEFEMDLESQSSNSLGSKFYGSSKERDGETKLPGTTRTVIKLLSISFKCVIWALTLVFKALYKVVVGLSKCLASEKL